MDKLLENTITFIGIIAIGFLLKKIGVFKDNDHQVITKIAFHITAPAAVIINFSNMQSDWSYLLLIGFGLLCNLIAAASAYAASRKNAASEKAVFLLMTPGYNINSFALPYAQSFLGPAGVVPVCLFDMGNAVMTLGGNYALASWAIYGSSKSGLREVGRRMMRSTPFIACIVMLMLVSCNLRLPNFAISMASFIAMANGPISMLALGAMLELNMDKQNLMLAFKALGLRYVVNLALAVAVYALMPFSAGLRQAIIFGLFAPMSALAPMYVEKCNGNTAAASIAGSISILISMAAITLILLFL